jgi:AmmeMemoRadiSam system protein B
VKHSERPRLVPVESQVITCDDGERLMVLRDPAGIAGEGLGLSPAAYWVAAQLDGSRTPAEVLAHARSSGARLAAAELAALIDALSEAGFLEGPAREAQRRRALREFRAQSARPPSCAGGVYPTDPDALRSALDGWLRHPDGSAPEALPRGPVRLVIAPHIDYARGAAGYAHAYRALAAADADLFVVFGTAHTTPPHLFTLTRLDQDTPLGPVRTDRAVVEALAAELGETELFDDELAHRDEHSVELQLVMLAHVVRRAFTVVPVLCSSISHLPDPAPATARFLSALGRAVQGRDVCWVAGADLAHVGPLYGDPRPPSARELASLADQDRRTLRRVASGDAAGFHREAIRDDKRRRLCGIAPIYAALRASGLPAQLLHYQQWTDGIDSVSFVAAAG